MKIKREYSIAILVLGGAALLVFGVNYLKGRDLLRKRNVYHAVYGDVSGINESSPVYFNGFKVGQVVRTVLLPDGSGRIAVSFQLNERDLALSKDTRVRIYSSDLFSRALQLVPGRGGGLAQAGDTLLGDVQLSLTDAVGEQLDPLKRRAEVMFANIDSLLVALQQLLNDTTISDIDASFASVRGTLETVNATARRIDGLVVDESAAIHAIVANIRQMSANLVAYDRDLSRILVNLDSATSALADGRLNKVVDNLAEGSAHLKEVMAGVDRGEGSMGALLKNDTLYRNMESASRELDLLLEDLRLNPNRYVSLSLFGRKDRLPKLSDSDIDRIKRSMEQDGKKP